MPIEFYIVSAVVIGLLGLNLFLVSRNHTANTGGKDVTLDLKNMSDAVGEMLREFKPADGASISYRINSLVTSEIERAKDAVWTRAAQQEAVQAVRGIHESLGRITVGSATELEKLDAITIMLASQGREQAKIVNQISASGRDAGIESAVNNRLSKQEGVQVTGGTVNAAQDLVAHDVIAVPPPPPPPPVEVPANTTTVAEIAPGEELKVVGKEKPKTE